MAKIELIINGMMSNKRFDSWFAFEEYVRQTTAAHPTWEIEGEEVTRHQFVEETKTDKSGHVTSELYQVAVCSDSEHIMPRGNGCFRSEIMKFHREFNYKRSRL